MDARRNRYSLRSGPNSRTTETGNQPFLDLSNFNLTPIETLRKLCSTTTAAATATATTTTSSAGTSSNLHCSLPKSPISGSKSDSKSSKPCNDNSTDAKSETSVGSSTFVQVPNPSRFGISTPVRVHSSPTSSASGNGELAAYGQRKAIVLPCSSNFLKNKSGKGEVVAEPGLPPRSNKGKEKVTVKPFNCLHPENKKGDSEMVAKLASSVLSDGNKGKGKGIVLLPAKNKKDRGKENFEPLSSSPPKNNKDTGNAILSISSYHGNKNKGKDIVEHVSELSTEKKKNKGKETFEFLGSPPPKSKDRGKAIVNIGSSCKKTMGEEISDVSLKSSPSKKTRGKRKSDTSAFSCPPLPKTRNVRKKINEVGDVELPGSRTVPNTKKSRPSKYQLPKEFVEEKRAYFKEIDEFELPEEEASD